MMILDEVGATGRVASLKNDGEACYAIGQRRTFVSISMVLVFWPLGLFWPLGAWGYDLPSRRCSTTTDYHLSSLLVYDDALTENAVLSTFFLVCRMAACA